MDALSSQANVGGYKAVLLAAAAYGRYFPLLTTAAGTAKPANVLILGIGVAGLQAIGTARRLGAIVKAYDVRKETKEQAESLGAGFIVLKSAVDATGEGGYARALTPEEQKAQQDELNGHIATMDVVITTAQVPGRRPPLLVTADAVRAMKSGSVIVDMAASALGGNVELSQAGETIVTENGVTIIAPDNLPASMPAGASAFYARNVYELVHHLVKDGVLPLDMSDEITAATVIATGGAVVQEATRKLLEPAPPLEVPHEPRAAQRPGHLRARHPGRLRGHQQGPGDAAHAADVGRQLHPRHRPGGRHAHRRRGRQPGLLRAGLRRRRLRGHERGRRLCRDRPHAPDVPQEARRPTQDRGRVMSPEWIYTFVFLAWLAGAAAFVIGLHQMNSPATARAGNRLSAGGMTLAVLATIPYLATRPGGLSTTAIAIIVVGFVIGGGVGLWMAKTVQMTAMPQLVSLFNAVGGGAAALVAIDDYLRIVGTDELIVSTAIFVVLGAVIGCVTFSGSLIASGKLQGLITGKPIMVPGGRIGAAPAEQAPATRPAEERQAEEPGGSRRLHGRQTTWPGVRFPA